jgi:hypothetical protein
VRGRTIVRLRIACAAEWDVRGGYPPPPFLLKVLKRETLGLDLGCEGGFRVQDRRARVRRAARLGWLRCGVGPVPVYGMGWGDCAMRGREKSPVVVRGLGDLGVDSHRVQSELRSAESSRASPRAVGFTRNGGDACLDGPVSIPFLLNASDGSVRTPSRPLAVLEVCFWERGWEMFVFCSHLTQVVRL